MKVLHTADLHITEDSRFPRDEAVLQYLARIAHDEEVDAVLIAGDIFGHESGRASTPAERALFARFLVRLGTQVFIVYGNHDAPEELVPFESFPGVFLSNGIEAIGPHVLGLSWPRARIMGAGREALSLEERRETARQIISTALLQVKAKLLPPRILLGHLQVAGTVFGGGEYGATDEIEFTGEELDEWGFSYVALGHIHAPQEVGKSAWYAGAPRHFNFGDVGQRSVNIVEINPGEAVAVRQVPIDCPRMVTMEGTWNGKQVIWGLNVRPGNGRPLSLEGADVRILINYAEEHQATLPSEEVLRQPAREQGAGWIKVVTRMEPSTRRRAPMIAKAVSARDKFGVYCDSVTPHPDSEVISRGVSIIEDLERRDHGEEQGG